MLSVVWAEIKSLQANVFNYTQLYISIESTGYQPTARKPDAAQGTSSRGPFEAKASRSTIRYRRICLISWFQ